MSKTSNILKDDVADTDELQEYLIIHDVVYSLITRHFLPLMWNKTFKNEKLAFEQPTWINIPKHNKMAYSIAYFSKYKISERKLIFLFCILGQQTGIVFHH